MVAQAEGHIPHKVVEEKANSRMIIVKDITEESVIWGHLLVSMITGVLTVINSDTRSWCAIN